MGLDEANGESDAINPSLVVMEECLKELICCTEAVDGDPDIKT